ncbi:PREDICTED: aldehyde oxidase-like [Condylura cristata]|uniref:aldehyde oxidase-like n=1 Tax=Condylura cristata TaxID=143302 RepID=UPI000643D579|nr:PREDICTED: aldehyde oxidase-like [Condylura cristata]
MRASAPQAPRGASLDAATELIFYVNGRKVTEKNVDPETMLLPYLRKKLRFTGTKYGCGGGGCGACTVMISRYNPITKKIRHYPANACLTPVCSLYGAAVTTVEGIGSTKTRIHPVQERIAKCHGTQCGFCTPGMVMSIYTLLRNHPEPTLNQLTDALDGNLCRCTGYRPIIDACKTFCKTSGCCQNKVNGVCCLDQGRNGLPEFEEGNKVSPKLFSEEEFLPLDPSQELIFPPELMMMAEKQPPRTRVFHGEKMIWISPVTLKELLEAKAQYPQAPVVMGNTSVGPDVKFKGVFHPVVISPDRIEELNVVDCAHNGLTLGAGLSLAQVKDILADVITKLPEEKTQTFRALLKHLGTLAGAQIRNMASLGGHIMSRHLDSDLNPLLAVGNCALHVLSKEGERQIPLNGQFLRKCPSADLKPEEILISVNIPYSRKWEFVSAFRQAQRQQNALAIVNAGMRVFFGDGEGIIRELSIFYGGVGPTTICAKNSCKKLTGRPWNEKMLDEACRLLLDEVSLPGSAPGGKVEFRRTLIVSFFFKFYLEVSQILKRMDPVYCPSLADKNEDALEDLHSRHRGHQLMYQNIDPKQLPQDPIGQPIMHLSGIKHSTGEAVYCDDMPAVDQELFLTLVTSSRAHAKIVSIDVSEALSLPGVVDVIAEEQLEGLNCFNSLTQPEKLLETDEVSCVGQLVCAVIAESEVQAKRAAKKVKIVYQDLEPLILTIEDAIQHNSFFEGEKKLECGNVDEAFKVADQTLEGEIHMGGQEHFYMETQSMLVVPKGEDQEIDIYVSTQYPKFIQDMVASTLKIPANKVMCHVKRVGGAFGGKVVKTSILAAISAFAANKHGRAVRCVLERGEDMLITGGRHPFLGKYKVIEHGLLKLDNAYKFPNLRCRGRACRTNLPSNTALRGFGFPQTGFITESCIMEVAAKCGLSPEEVRMINMYKEIDQTPYKQEINAKNLVQCWKECMTMASYSLRKAAVEKFNSENYWKKKGLAMVPLKFPVGVESLAAGQASALVHIYLDGSVLVTHGGIEMGQGVHTKMIQVVSRELRMPLSNVHLRGTSTETIPNANPSGGSVVADLNGLAVQDACQTLLKRLEPIISKNPQGTWKEWAEAAFNESISLTATGYFRTITVIYGKTFHPYSVRIFFFYPLCQNLAQIEGAFIQGMGLYTMEELNYSPQGVLYTRGPNQYKIPAICDIPTELHISLLPPSENSNTLYSSKGLGESGVFLGCSVFFAIHDAVNAARRERGLTGPLKLNSPLTPEKIRMACEDKFTKMFEVVTQSLCPPPTCSPFLMLKLQGRPVLEQPRIIAVSISGTAKAVKVQLSGVAGFQNIRDGISLSGLRLDVATASPRRTSLPPDPPHRQDADNSSGTLARPRQHFRTRQPGSTYHWRNKPFLKGRRFITTHKTLKNHPSPQRVPKYLEDRLEEQQCVLFKASLCCPVRSFQDSQAASISEGGAFQTLALGFHQDTSSGRLWTRICQSCLALIQQGRLLIGTQGMTFLVWAEVVHVPGKTL